MAMIIQHNISALNTQKNLTLTNRELSKSLEKLSSGYRINTGADAPADLVISEQLRAQTVGLDRAIRNTNEAMNVLSIAEGALNEMNSILKRMRQLALHAANSGITSPEQVAADQAEVDSSIQTIDRIANTTKYSDQFLLNGGKGLVYERQTIVKGTQNNPLLDVSATRIDQIFKREGFNITMAFSGAESPDDDTSIGQADLTKAAMKAYFEIDAANADADIDDTSNTLSKAQSFILTGTKGSRLFNFDVGATMGQIAQSVSNVADSTGVDASLIFASDQTISGGYLVSDNLAVIGGAAARSVGDMVISNNFTSTTSTAAIVETIATAPTQIVLGQTTDGQGRIWLKVTGDDTYELYKDRSLSAESLVGHGAEGTGVIMDNNSGLAGLEITSIADGNAGEIVTLNFFGLEGTQDIDGGAGTEASVNYTGSFEATPTASNNTFASELSFFSGIELGKNTDAEGRLYFKTVVDTGAQTGQVFAYKDARMSDADLVAKSQASVDLSDDSTVILSEVKNSEGTNGTGLAIALSTGANGGFDNTGGTDDAEHTGQVQFTNLGVRISSQEYGSDEFVRIQQDAGTIWQYYSQKDSDSATMVDASKGGVTVQQNGQDATLSINGQRVVTDGLKLNLSTQDVTGQLVFNEGKVGSTTIAQVGYTAGSLTSMAALLTATTAGYDNSSSAANTRDQLYDPDEAEVAGTDNQNAVSNPGIVGNDNNSANHNIRNIGAVLNNPGHSTSESILHFQSGMQFQLGEGVGDQERTVYGIQSMAVSNLGRTNFSGQFDENVAVIEEKTLSMQNMLGGGLASLANDPVKALSIIDQAIKDVSELRSRLGATQMNLLQTNANNLTVSMENIVKTESFIRDADMAAESTQFTKNQILMQAGTSMLAQANVQAQNVLQLLG